MNIEICDILNRDLGQAKDVVKGVKRRIGSKNPKVQLLALTLLTTGNSHKELGRHCAHACHGEGCSSRDGEDCEKEGHEENQGAMKEPLVLIRLSLDECIYVKLCSDIEFRGKLHSLNKGLVDGFTKKIENATRQDE